jgi:uncharacterized membrane protein
MAITGMLSIAFIGKIEWNSYAAPLPCRHRPTGRSAMRISLTHSLAKTATFAVLHFTVAFSIAYLLTGNVGIAGAIALLEPLANTVAYFFHERAWARFSLRAASA